MKEIKDSYIRVRCTIGEREAMKKATKSKKTTTSQEVVKFMNRYIKKVMK